MPFGIAFGVACVEAGLSLLQAIGFSTLVFGGSAQFAAVSVLGDGGAVASAVTAGALLNLRSLAFGVVMAPALRGPFWRRALESQVMIDESAAVGVGQPDLRSKRIGYLAGGLGVFLTWNVATILGVVVLGGTDGLIEAAGIDATIPAAFLALLWPRLANTEQRMIAVAGALIALISTPLLPPGLPIILAATAVLFLRPWAPAAS